MPLHWLQVSALRALGCARSLAGLAGFLARDLDRGLGAGGGLLERDLKVVPQVGASLRAAATAALPKMSPRPKTSPSPEKMSEKSAKIVGSKPAPPPAPPFDARMAEAIVQPALLRVGEHRVGFRGFLECLLRLVVAGIPVGMDISTRACDTHS